MDYDNEIPEQVKMMYDAWAQSARRAFEDDVMRKMALASADFVTELTDMPETVEVRKFGLALFMMGFMAHENDWAAVDWSATTR